MSWVEDMNYYDPSDEDIEQWFKDKAINDIVENLNSVALKNLYDYLNDNYVMLVSNIMLRFANNISLSNKQKRCVARFIYDHDLMDIIKSN